MNIAAIPLLKEIFGKIVGLSDHSIGSLASVVAVTLGAKVIEKHVKLDDSEPSADAAFSMTMSQFASMITDIRNAIIIKGEPTLKLTENEINGLVFRRSLVASETIRIGEKFTEENIRSIRPSIGVKPKYYNLLLNKKAKKNYSFGDPISMEKIM